MRPDVIKGLIDAQRALEEVNVKEPCYNGLARPAVIKPSFIIFVVYGKVQTFQLQCSGELLFDHIFVLCHDLLWYIHSCSFS